MNTTSSPVVGPNSDYSAQSKILSVNRPSHRYSNAPPTHRLTAVAPRKSFAPEKPQRNLVNFAANANDKRQTGQASTLIPDSSLYFDLYLRDVPMQAPKELLVASISST
jgi:hypothetical protein